ncbi:MAG: 50S ribosomal protein L21 [Candidatus Zixiibacteriota bacterium]
MYAIFRLAGFQFRAEEGEVLRVPAKLQTTGDHVEISDILLVKSSDHALVGTPFVSGAKIEAALIGRGKGEKVHGYKYKRRTKARKALGHRQDYSELKIQKIVAPKN